MAKENKKKLVFKVVKNEDVLWNLQSPDGTVFDAVSYDAYKAVENGTLDSYKPKNNNEKDAISKFRSHLGTPLVLPNGVELGYISYDAHRHITGNTKDNYIKDVHKYAPTTEGNTKTSPDDKSLDLSGGKLSWSPGTSPKNVPKNVPKNFNGYVPKNDTEAATLEKFFNYATVFSADALSGGLKYKNEIGRYGKGNIDLYDRPKHVNSDGSISTVRSITVEMDGKYVVIPTVVSERNGKSKVLSDDEAIEQYKKTGQFLGKFDNLYDADIYAQKLHLAQDFYYNSRYKTTANGKERTFNPMNPNMYKETGFDDLEYDVINKNPDAVNIQFSNDLATNKTIVGADKAFLESMNEDEVAVFNYLYHTQGADKAYEFIGKISSDVKYRHRVNTQNKWAAEAAENPVGTSVFSVLISPMKAVSYIGQVADYAHDGKIDQNAGYNKYVHIPNAIRSEVSSQIENSGKWGKVGSTAYNLGMSMADSLYGVAVSGGQQGLSLAIMGAGAAADTTVAAKDRGLSDTQAFWLGTISGAGEVVSEKMSFDTVMDANLFTQSAKKYFVKSATVGGLEEVVADGINFVADTIIAGDKSLWSQSIQNYMKQGKSKSEAVGLTIGNKLLETGLSFVGGALSTGVMSLGGTVYNTAKIKETGSQFNTTADVANIIETGLNQPKNTDAYKNAVKLQENIKSGTPTDFEIGQQVLLNAGAVANKTDANVNKVKKLINKFQSYIRKSDSKTADVDTASTEKVIDNKTTVTKGVTTTKNVTVGDTFIDRDTNNILRVSERDDTTTVIDIITPKGNVKTVTYPNSGADTLVSDDRYKKVENSATNNQNNADLETTEAEETKNAEVVTTNVNNTVKQPGVNVGDVYEAEGKTYTIIRRENGRTTYTVTGKDGRTITRKVSNVVADINFTKPEVYTKIKDGQAVTGINAENTPVNSTTEAITSVTDGIPIVEADNVVEIGDFSTVRESNKTENTEKITVGMSDDARAELLNKKSINVVRFNATKAKIFENIDFEALQTTLTKHAKPIIEKVANDFGILNKIYFNPDIELEFEYSRSSLKESMNKQHTMYGDFIKMLSVFPDVINNAVGIETHKDKYAGTVREDPTLKQMYVLASALADETDIIPVKLEVKEFSDKANKLYLSVVLAKKESRYPHGSLGQNQLHTATPTSVISIADLVGIVNPSEGDFLKYFPDSMLDSEQIESKNKALDKDTEKVKKLSQKSKTRTDNVVDESDAEVVEIVDAVEETLIPGAKEKLLDALEKGGHRADIITLAKALRKAYKNTGTISKMANFFKDRGAKVISAIESTIDTTVNETVTNQNTKDISKNINQLLEDYSEAVDDILTVSDETAKNLADKRVVVEVLKNTPEVILNNVEGARDLKVIINYNKLYLAVRKDGVFKGHYHNIGEEIAKRLPEFLKNPDAIIQLANGRLNLFATVETDRGNNGIISVELNSTKDIGGKNEDYNVIVTLFSSDDQYAQNLISGEGVTEKYKREDLSQVNPQLYKWLATINDKSSIDNSISQEKDIVNSNENTDKKSGTKLTDKCTLTETKRTDNGKDIWVVSLNDRISSDEFSELRKIIKEHGGSYSRFAKSPDGKSIPGFIFNSEPTAEAIKAFNDFFDNNEVQDSGNNNVTETSSEEVLNNQPKSDKVEEKATPVEEIQKESHTPQVKEDFKVGDILEFDGEQWECVGIDTMMIDFVNVDKNAFQQNMSVILPYELFKEKTDYKVVKNQDEEAAKQTSTKTTEKEPEKTVSKGEASKRIADYVANKLTKGEKLSALELQKIATEAFGGTMANNAFTVKDAYDAMELGVNMHILSMEDISSEKMLALLELLPTQTKRTEEMVKFQQFSTPPSIAYLANYTANVNSNDIMLEPSAGIGGIAVFAKKDGAKVYVNELDNRRLDVLKHMPFDGFFNEDAEQLNNILGGEIEPTVIVMNPPFSSSSERNMKNTKIGAKHIEQALKILAPNGRLVAIVGNGMADGAPAFRTWWKDIKSQYNVKANIGVNGKNYNKYGTNFDIQILVIDKNGPTDQTVTGYVDTLQELQEKLGGIRDARPSIDYSGNEQRTPTTTRKETSPKGKTTDNGDSIVSDTGSRTVKGKSGDTSRTSGKSNVQDIQSTDAERGKSASVTTENTDDMVDEDGRVGSRQSDRSITEENSVGIDNSDSGKSDIQTGRDKPRKRVKRKELTDSIFEQYQTQPLKVKNAQPHPAKVSESAAMSAIEPPTITYKPNIPQDIIENGVVSDVQLEAISYAGQSHSQVLPNGTTRGFFLGDGTGIGKGRTIAGMMLDNFNQGRKKAVWVTLNSSLVNDAKRDVKALFGDSDLVTQFVGGNKADKILSTDEAIMVISYSTLAKGFDNKDSNFEKLINWLGKDFDGLIVFDEAHKMGNATSTKGTRGVKKASQTGIAGIALQEALPNARIVYSSATGATEVENLRYAERLGLWGEGTPFVKGDDFVSKVKAGGLAAMELIARDMKAMGVYLSRNISYDDVRYDKITHKLTAQQTKIYDELARSWQIVLNNINKALESTNQDKDGHARGRALGAFWSSQQRFFNQILTSMQVPSVISDIEKQLTDGKSCVIQLVSTNEAAQNQEFERLKSEDLDLDEFDLTPKQVLMSLIENSFPVQQFEEYRDDNGNVRSRPVYDSKGNPVINREAVQQREALLTKLGSIKVPSSPIDMIINHFGTDLVAENTGRARRVIQKDGKTIEEKIGNKKDADVDAFQNGDKRIIIFSKAGGTGKSYHADKAARNQQQRVHYLLEAGWQADNAVQGFGRSHRSNQASAPIFKLVTTNLKGQMRFISTIAKRLDQLGAMTKGQRQAGGQGMFSASDNLENSFAADVLAGFYKDLVSNKVDGIDEGLEILEKLGLKNKILDEYNRIIPTATELREVNKFLNRILSLESTEQNTVFEGYSQRLQDATEKALQAGTLDKGLENYKADKITLNEVQDIREDERSGAKTKYYNLTAEHKIKPVKFMDIPTELKSFVGFYKNKNTGAVRAVYQTSSSTDLHGNVVNNYKLMGQVKNEYIPQHRFYGNWEKLESSNAETLWNEEVSKLPEYRQENLHLISGVVLPVWDKLPTENVRIYRVLTSDGEMLIGRVVSEDMIDGTLRKLGATRKKEQIATKDLIAGIKNGDTVYLENDWKIKQSKVSNESRIEIVGPSYEHYDLLAGKGVFTERISYNTRYFVPTDTNTEKIIDDIIKFSPVLRVESADSSNGVHYSKQNVDTVRGGKDLNSLSAGYRNYTYEALTDKDDMLVTILDEDSMYDENGKLNRAEIIDKGIKNVRKKNNIKNTENNSFVYVSDIDKNVLVTKDGLRHGLARKAEATALVTTKIGDILENSVKVNELNARGYTSGGYILLGIAVDKENNYYPVRIIINNYSVDNIEVLDVLYAVNAKKKDQSSKEAGSAEVSAPLIKGLSLKNQSSKEAGSAEVSAPLIKGSSTISIADLLEVVKKDFSDVLTDDVLSHLGVERKSSSLSESVKYSKDVMGSDGTSRWRTERVEGSKNSKNGVSISQIVKDIRNKFGIPIATGKVTSLDASAQYNEKEETIRVRIANNLPDIAHELGHHTDKKYGFSKFDSIEALLKVVPQELLDQYTEKEWAFESVAWFTEQYLKNANNARRMCQDFYDDFVSVLTKEDLKAINEVANAVNEYMSLDFSSRVKASIVSGNVKEKTTLSEKAKKMHADWVDGFLPLKDVIDYVEETKGVSLAGSRNAYTLATNSLNARAIANFNTVHGFRDLNGRFVDGAKSYIECIANVNRKDLETLDEYLVLKHSLEWINPKNEDVIKKRVFADDTLEDVEAISKRITEIEKKHPEMKKTAENLYEYQRNILKYIVMPAGGMAEATYNSLNEKYPCYVPFYRAVGKDGAKTKATFANQKSPLKRAKGSGELIISPLESIIKNTDKMVKFALRNQTMQVLADYADTVDGFGKFMEKVPPDMMPHSTDITRLKERFEEALQQVVSSGEEYFAVSDLFDEIFGNSVTDFTPIKNDNKKIVTVLKNGEFSYYQIHDGDLYGAVAELTSKNLEGIFALSNKLMQPMKLLITQNNPIFAVTNALRDIGTAYKHSSINNPAVFAAKYISALKEVITRGDVYKQYQAMGGGHNSELSANIDQIKRTIRKVSEKDMGKARRIAYSIFLHPVSTVASLNDYIESTPRVMEFMRTLEIGGDLQQAIYKADDITTNFKRSGRGSLAKNVNSLIMFNNAALQGLNKTYRSLTNKNTAERNKTLLKWALFALIGSAIQLWWNKKNDDEGYKNLSSYKKNNFYNFSIGDGLFISIPKARETALLDSFTERAIEYVFGNDDAFYDFGGYITQQILPPMLPATLNPVDAAHDVLGSTILGGIADVGWNKNFMDIPIEGKYDEYLPSNERYDENTSKLAYGLGQTKLARVMDMSPKKIDHLISSYTGIFGQINRALFPMNEERRDASIGLKNKFISDSNYSTDLLNKAYDNTDKAKLNWEYDDNINNAIEYEQNAIITSYISGMNKAIKALPKDEQREGRKYLLKTLNTWNYDITPQQSNMQSRLKDESISEDYIFMELPSSELSWTVNGQKYIYQMTPQEYNKYVTDYLTVVENARKKYGEKSQEGYTQAKQAAKEYMSKYKKNILKPQYLPKATKVND